MIIEPYRDKWQDPVLNLILHIQRDEFGVPVTAEDQPDLKSIPDFYMRGAGNFWVALDQDNIVGTIALLDIGDRTVALRKMFVAATHRGKAHNVAAALLQSAIDACRANDVRDIYLGTTEHFLAAHRFYEKNSFTEVPKESLPASFPRMRVDTKFYRRYL